MASGHPRDWKCSRLAIRRANFKCENISLAFYYSGECTMSHCDIIAHMTSGNSMTASLPSLNLMLDVGVFRFSLLV